METVSHSSEEASAIELPEAWRTSKAPIEVDMGSHKGTFLVAMARLYPRHRFLGIERQPSRVERCQKKIEREALTNAYTIQAEGLEVFRDLKLKAAVIHVSFPDPWPKRRHWTKRLVNDRFLRDAWNCLEPQGVLRLMTDDAAYFSAMEIAADACDGFAAVEWDDGRQYPPTEFQMKFEFLPVHRLALRRCDSMSSE